MTQVTRIQVVVQGRVQGVGYRQFVRQLAERLQLTGWVRNLPDGSVEVLLEGEVEQMNEVISLLQRGPTAAKVTHLESRRESGGREYTAFVILR